MPFQILGMFVYPTLPKSLGMLLVYPKRMAGVNQRMAGANQRMAGVNQRRLFYQGACSTDNVNTMITILLILNTLSRKSEQ